MKTSIRQYLRLLSKYLKKRWMGLLLLAFLLGGNVVLTLINPQIIRSFIDLAAAGGAFEQLIKAAMWFTVIVVAQQIFMVFSTYICQNIGWIATNELREDLVMHCIQLDMPFHKSKQPGEMIERLDKDVAMLFDFFSKMIIDILNNIILIIGALIFLLREDWRVSLALGVFAWISLVILNKGQKAGIHYWIDEREASAKFLGFLGEQISNIEDIKACGAVEDSMYKYIKRFRYIFPIKMKASLEPNKLWSVSVILSATSVIIALSFGGYLWLKGGISAGTVYLIFNYTLIINSPLSYLRKKLGDLQKAEASIIRVGELFEMKSSIEDGSVELSHGNALSLKIDDISFGYTDDTPVLKNVSFELGPKRIMGLIGRTGSGKTTLGRLIMRLYEPGSGEILIDGKDIKTIKMESLRKSIAYVSQDTKLFHATIRDNLTFFDSTISDSDILKALENAGLREWVEAMPEGLNTLIESGGDNLSSGEAQLIAFTRAFLKKPGLVILDEASSKLDPIMEKHMEKAVDRLLSESSCIIIAHRLSTLKRADDILILSDGKVVEYGTQEELLNNTTSNYYNLLQTGIEEVLV